MKKHPQPFNRTSLNRGSALPPVGGAVRADRVGLGQRFLTLAYRLFTSSPARAALTIFVLVTLIFACLLAMPFASANQQPTAFHDALLVATSAISVTGLTSVNTAEHWSTAGHVVILAGIQLGGLGIVTMAGLFTMMVSRRLGLRSRLLTNESLGATRLGDVRSLLVTVIATTLVLQAGLAAVLVPRMIELTGSFGEGLWRGIFYAVSSFCNAGFSLDPNGFASYGHDHVVLMTVNAGVILGSLGYPVVSVLHHMIFNKARMNLHTRLTLEVSLGLLLAGMVLVALFEWNNPETLGSYGLLGKLSVALFASGMTRSGGFNVYPLEAQREETLVLMDALMFVGGGSASTAGGIKVTTLAVLILAIIAEARGNEHVMAHRREISSETIRIAIGVLMAGATIVLIATMLLLAITEESLNNVLFEVLSAFSTVGLSTGLTENAEPATKYVLSALMFIGRVGTISFAAGLALRQRNTLYRYPTERPIIG